MKKELYVAPDTEVESILIETNLLTGTGTHEGFGEEETPDD